MERVMEQKQTAEVFENDIQMYLTMFCEENQIEDMKRESQSVWNSALMYIKRHVFTPSNILKSHNNITNNNNSINSNYNAYNYDLVNSICDYYIYLCMLNDKEVSAIGFSLLTGIDRYTLATWRDEGTKLSKVSSDIGKKISDFREESLSNKLATGKQNPVGVIAILNRQFGWASPYTSDARKQQQALSGADIRAMLSTRNGQNEPKQLETQDIVMEE